MKARIVPALAASLFVTPALAVDWNFYHHQSAPLFATSMKSADSRRVRRTLVGAPGAWRRTLVSDSCTSRYTVSWRDSSSCTDSTLVEVCTPDCSENSRARISREACRPRLASADGRRSSMIRR